jgi:acetyl-CoA carboxylase biotin carboxyl carrier protein
LAKKKDNPKKVIKSHSNSPMDLGLLKEITRLMTENDLNTVEVRDGDKRVILKRGNLVVASAAPMVAAPTAAQTAAAAAAGGGSPEIANPDANLIPIKSPMVGTFYTSSSPDAKPFVSVGTTVDEDTDVCIIEAMKVFNNIKAECRGTITKIQVENGATVEFGQVLFLVKP